MSKYAGFTSRNAYGLIRQQGSALIIALVFLLIMTLIGTASMQGTSQQESMAGNVRDRNLAFQAAEAALRAGERDIINGISTPIAGQAQGANPGMFWTSYFQNNPSRYLNNTTTAPTAGVLAFTQVNRQPSYVIENMPISEDIQNCTDPAVNCYRITAYGVGGTPNAIVILQSKYYKIK